MSSHIICLLVTIRANNPIVPSTLRAQTTEVPANPRNVSVKILFGIKAAARSNPVNLFHFTCIRGQTHQTWLTLPYGFLIACTSSVMPGYIVELEWESCQEFRGLGHDWLQLGLIARVAKQWTSGGRPFRQLLGRGANDRIIASLSLQLFNEHLCSPAYSQASAFWPGMLIFPRFRTSICLHFSPNVNSLHMY